MSLMGWVVTVLVCMGLIATTLELAFYTSHPRWWPQSHPAGPFESAVLSVWRYYTQFDPVFELPPPWLRVLCWIEVLLFGPLYFLSAYALHTRRPWTRLVVWPFAGALLYSTLVYFLMEFVSEPVPGTHQLVVLVVNAPWTLLPLVLFAVA